MKITEKQRHVLAHIGEVRRGWVGRWSRWKLGEQDVTSIVQTLRRYGLISANGQERLKLHPKFMERLLTEPKKKVVTHV